MKRLWAVLAFLSWLGFGCSERPLEPWSEELGFLGDWYSAQTWVDTTKTWTKVDSGIVTARLPFYYKELHIFRFWPAGGFVSYLEITYEGTPELGWVAPFRPFYNKKWVICRGTWTNRGDLLRLLVESVEGRGRWSVWPGQEQTLVWKRAGDKLYLWWRDSEGVFSDKSFGVVFRPIEDPSEFPVFPTLKVAGGGGS